MDYDAPMKRAALPVVLSLLLLAVPAVARGGEPVPERGPVFPSILLQPLDGGEPVSIETFRGRPLLLTFWATWCGPCRAELPELQRLYDELAGRGFVVAAVNVDRSPRGVETFLERLRLTLPVYRVDQGTLARLGVRSIPMNVLLDAEGRVVRLFQGYSPGMVPELRRELEPLLAGNKGGGGA